MPFQSFTLFSSSTASQMLNNYGIQKKIHDSINEEKMTLLNRNQNQKTKKTMTKNKVVMLTVQVLLLVM